VNTGIYTYHNFARTVAAELQQARVDGILVDKGVDGVNRVEDNGMDCS